MKNKRKKAATFAEVTTCKKKPLAKAYQNLSPQEREKAIKQIAKRRSETPKIYRNTYDKAISGKSLRSATNSHCLHCVGDLREDVRQCTCYSCAHWPYHPYQQGCDEDAISFSKTPTEDPDYDAESSNANEGGLG